jgi:hypothetical protein
MTAEDIYNETGFWPDDQKPTKGYSYFTFHSWAHAQNLAKDHGIPTYKDGLRASEKRFVSQCSNIVGA